MCFAEGQNFPVVRCLELSYVGGLLGNGAYVCGLHSTMKKEKCLVYTFTDMLLDLTFEENLVRVRPECIVRVFSRSDELISSHNHINIHHWNEVHTLSRLMAQHNETNARISLVRFNLDGSDAKDIIHRHFSDRFTANIGQLSIDLTFTVQDTVTMPAYKAAIESHGFRLAWKDHLWSDEEANGQVMCRYSHLWVSTDSNPLLAKDE